MKVFCYPPPDPDGSLPRPNLDSYAYALVAADGHSPARFLRSTFREEFLDVNSLSSEKRVDLASLLFVLKPVSREEIK